MGSSLAIAKTIVVPPLVSLAIYIVLSYLVVPFFRRYHQRYVQYLPLHSISAHTTSIRERIADAVMHIVLPSSWRRGAHLHPDLNDTISIYDEEGETMVGIDVDPARREALEQRRSLTSESQVRLSRELEEGFMDDSDDEDGGHNREQSRPH